jgi:hypothetical protein
MIANCTNCRFSSLDLGKGSQAGKVLCRLNPPTPFAIAITTNQGVTVKVTSLWATVTADDVCHQHLPAGKPQ